MSRGTQKECCHKQHSFSLTITKPSTRLALNSLGIGILGAGGDTSVLAVNVEYAYTHIAGIAVATSTNCMVARRASTRIDASGQVSIMQSPNWFGNR